MFLTGQGYSIQSVTWLFKVTVLDILLGSVTNKPPSRVTKRNLQVRSRTEEAWDLLVSNRPALRPHPLRSSPRGLGTESRAASEDWASTGAARRLRSVSSVDRPLNPRAKPGRSSMGPRSIWFASEGPKHRDGQ